MVLLTPGRGLCESSSRIIALPSPAYPLRTSAPVPPGSLVLAPAAVASSVLFSSRIRRATLQRRRFEQRAFRVEFVMVRGSLACLACPSRRERRQAAFCPAACTLPARGGFRRARGVAGADTVRRCRFVRIVVGLGVKTANPLSKRLLSEYAVTAAVLWL